MKKISVVIPAWNGEKTIEACVKSLLNQSYRAREIMVVDNGSTDNTLSILKRLKVTIIKSKVNLGVAGGRNTGLKKAKSNFDYILFFDHDMLAEKNMLINLVRVAEDKLAGIVTPKIYYVKPKNMIWSAGTGINLWTGQVIFRNGEDIGQFSNLEEVDVAPAAMLVSKKVIKKIKGFDNNIFAVWEDTIFSFKARKAGFKIFYAPDAIARHDLKYDPAAEAKRLLDRYGYFIGRNRILFMKQFANNYLLFLFILPVYLIYYLVLALKYSQLKGYFNFLKGTASGLLHV